MRSTGASSKSAGVRLDEAAVANLAYVVPNDGVIITSFTGTGGCKMRSKNYAASWDDMERTGGGDDIAAAADETVNCFVACDGSTVALQSTGAGNNITMIGFSVT